jgi:DNA-binding MarR family transcriptional regulator
MAEAPRPAADQIMALLVSPTDDRCEEFARSVGRLIQRHPEASTLRRLRGEAAAWVDRAAGEGPLDSDARSAIARVSAVTGVLGGLLEDADFKDDDELLRQGILRLLAEHGPARSSDVADMAARGRPQVSTILRQLDDQGLVGVVSDPPPVDGRSVVYELTAAGAEALGAATKTKRRTRQHSLRVGERLPSD